jgi:hypothetical protein
MLSIRIELQLRLGSRTIILNLKKPPRGLFAFHPEGWLAFLLLPAP